MRLTKLLLLVIILTGQIWSQETDDRACQKCHQSGTWFPLSSSPEFDHNRDTAFNLVDSHADLQCSQCHTGQGIEEFHKFSTTGNDCADCHQDIHDNYWGDRCEQCHTPESWNMGQAYRRHDETLFPLVAAHHRLSCYLCHRSPRSLPSLDCQVCHSTDFLPDLASHSGLDERADCANCHAPTSWKDILAINHGVFFPIYNGVHRGRWSSCSTCHNQAGDYQSFSCFGSGCHSISGMNSEHCEGGGCERCNGFTYPRTGVDSDDCYFCHSRGDKSTCGD
ncbi:MAG: hypothetical protein K9N35_00095 [Candidatus Marinimicrobia bacterium]|nr:hypothetical protein [Candidatus Neomarinimicrobiota bacterium]